MRAACLLALMLSAVPVSGQEAEEPPMIVIEGLEDETAPEAPAVPSVLLRESGPTRDGADARWLIPPRPVVGQAGGDGLYRMHGARARHDFRLYLPAEALEGTLTLAYRSSINILPEESAVTVSLNGVPLGSFRPSSFAALAAVPLALTGSAARAGENILSIEADHHHRIYCGAEAEFSLWTDVDLTQSGVSLPPAGLEPGPEGFIAALTAQAGAGRPVEISSPVQPSAEVVAGIATALGRAMGGAALPLTLRSPWAVSRAQARARVTLIPSDRAAVSFRDGGDGAITLVLEHPAQEAPDPALLAEALASASSPVAVSGAAALVPGEATRFADLGFATAISNEYYFRWDLPFRLPDDWLILASQKATLNLDYGFATGLPEGSLVLVKVNGTTVRMLPLDRDGGAIQPRLPVGFGARLLRPGLNALSFEAILPGDPPDQACPLRPTDMLTILDTSDLRVPASPRMQQPDMARLLDGLGPGGIRPAAPAALGRTLPVLSALQPRDGAEGGELIVASLADLPEIPLGSLGITRRDIESVLLQPVALPLAAAAPEAEAPAPQGRARLQLPGMQPEEAAEGGNRLDRIVQAVTAPAAAALQTLIHPGDGPLPEWLAGRPGQAMLLSLDPEHPQRLWLVQGPAADPVRIASALAAGRDAAGGPHGQVAVLAQDGSWSSWTSPLANPQLVEPLNLRNMRAVLGNLVSWQPPVLTLGMLGIAWLSALMALYFVTRTRGRRKK